VSAGARPNARAARSVDRVLGAVQSDEARGVSVRRPLPSTTLEQVDPFLQIDHVGPVDWEAGEAQWRPELPLRGFDTATFVLDGDVDISDSTGRRDRLNQGDLLWRSAGTGVVVREQPGKPLRSRGGRLHLLRLWVNLPRADRSGAPTARVVLRDQVPRVAFAAHVTARVLAGEVSGVRAAVQPRAGVSACLVELIARGRIELEAPEGVQAIAYVVEGTARVGRDLDAVRPGQAVVFAHDGDRVPLEVDGPGAPCTVLFVAGPPIGEPIARFGPFVASTMDEVHRATNDYRAGRFGKL
jgi:hypothetical protein